MSARGLGVEGVCRVQMITEHLCTLVQNTRFAGLYSVYEKIKGIPEEAGRRAQNSSKPASGSSQSEPCSRAMALMLAPSCIEHLSI